MRRTATILILLYFGLRLSHIDTFPLFIDEAFTIARARDVWALDPFGGVAQGKPLIPWVAAAAYPFENAVFVSRVIVLLAGVPGIATLIALGRHLFDRAVGLTAGLLFALMPFTFFWGRLAMSDMLAASWVLVVGWLIAVSLKRQSGFVSVLAGTALSIVILSRLPMIALLPVPIIGWWLLPGEKHQIRQVVVIYAACAATLLPVILLGLRGGDFGIGAARDSFVVTGSENLIEYVGRNIWTSLVWVRRYAGLPVLLFGGLGLLWGTVRFDRRILYAASLTLLPFGLFWLTASFVLPRYYLPGIGGLTLLAAMIITRMTRRRGVSWVLLALALVPMPAFIIRAYTDPTDLPLTEIDQYDYYHASTSGIGLVEGVSWLEEQDQDVAVICSARVTCDRLSAYLYGNESITITRTDILTPDWVRAEDAADRVVLIAEDDPPHSSAFEPGNEYLLTAEQTFERPGGDSRFVIYRVGAQ